MVRPTLKPNSGPNSVTTNSTLKNVGAIIQALTEHSQKCEDARKGIDYFENNRQRMRYVEFHAQGLCTSTGVVEAGCQVAIGERLTQSGMHWTVRGADAIIALTMREAQRTLRRLLGTPLRSPSCRERSAILSLSKPKARQWARRTCLHKRVVSCRGGSSGARITGAHIRSTAKITPAMQRVRTLA